MHGLALHPNEIMLLARAPSTMPCRSDCIPPTMLELHVYCTRFLVSAAHIPLYLYPFLSSPAKSRQYEFLRLTSLGVIGALVKQDNARVVDYLLKTEIIPMCLHIMKTGTDLSMTVATFIVQKILLDDQGLNYVCATPQRFFAVSQVLEQMVGK